MLLTDCSRFGTIIYRLNIAIMQSTELTPKQQVVELLRQAQSILIVTGREPNVDQVLSVFTLQAALNKMGKKSHAVITDALPDSTKLVDTSKISRNLDGVRDFIVSLDLAHVEVDKLKYDIQDGRLDVTITPAAGNFTPDDARFEYGAYQFDLVVVLGVHRIASIDRLLEENPTLFDGLHLINMDYHRVNESYGSVNYIDTMASSVSEMLIGTLESIAPGQLDADMATALLAGIMSATNRFTIAATTPKAMTVAAQLLSAGARQQEVVKVLYSEAASKLKAPEKKAQKVAEVLPQDTLAQLQRAAERLQNESLTQVTEDTQPTMTNGSVMPLGTSFSPVGTSAPLQ